jgi:hypothetical protein
MAFRDLTDVLGVSTPKVLPIRGRSVEFPGTISAWAGTLLLALRRAAAESIESGDVDPSDVAGLVLSTGAATEMDALRLERELLGDAGDVLDELGVMGEGRQHIIGTLTVWHLSGEEAATACWEGKAPVQPNRAKRRTTAGRSSKTAGVAGAVSRTAAGE